MDFEITPDGAVKFSPKIARGEHSATTEAQDVPIKAAFTILSRCLAEIGLTLWIAIDRLDEAFQAYPEIEVPALRALLRTYLDLSEFEGIKLKLFVRRDLFRRVTEGGFVNLTHVNARKFELIWDEEDLLDLLCRRIRKNSEFAREIGGMQTNEAIFDRLFPTQVDPGTRKPKTWVWIMRRIRDGNDIKPPRNLIDLISSAQVAQLRIEGRVQLEKDASFPLIQAESLKKGLTQLSNTRVNDTLLAETKSLAPVFEKFRGGKAEQNDASLGGLLGVDENMVKFYTKPLREIGFLEEIGGSYKIPTLYREGLEITQGKAFIGPSVLDLDPNEGE